MSKEILLEVDSNNLDRNKKNFSDISDYLKSLEIYTSKLKLDWQVLSSSEDNFSKINSKISFIHFLITQLEKDIKVHTNAQLKQQLEAIDLNSTDLKLNLGCGDNILENWINIDINSSNFKFNILNTLPFYDSSVQYVYLSHVLEHLNYKEPALSLMKEIKRVLMPEGIIRIVVPDIKVFLEFYSKGESSFFNYFSQKWQMPYHQTNLESFLHYAGAGSFPGIVDHHKYGYDFETIEKLLKSAGFQNVKRMTYQKSLDDNLLVDNSWAAKEVYKEHYLSLFVEAY